MTVAVEGAICTACGAACRPTANFCAHCGERLKAAPPQPTCPRGHRLEPDWKACPFCRSDQPERPLLETVMALAAAGKPLPKALMTPVEEVGAGAGSEAQPGQVAAVLATFSWNPKGQAFLARIGRNLIGAGAKASIRVEDPKMAEVHAALDIRGRSATLIHHAGEPSRVNGQAIGGVAALRHGDTIQTGDTLWRFARVEPPEPQGEVS